MQKSVKKWDSHSFIICGAICWFISSKSNGIANGSNVYNVEFVPYIIEYEELGSIS